ncbi:excalibur calcium-binding domain-containing protein [Arthrobacter halodurans]|uniref:Excalibur calcium-binding domain-containing protein n=1 Tax=Arthrobacter halodurans TaxID=516699 RepID=A0ABV4UQS0_9MICC
MTNFSGPLPARKNSRTRTWWMVVAVLAVLLILLLALVPGLVFVLSLLALLFGLAALIIGRVRWARIPNRKGAGAFTGAATALLVLSLIVFGAGSAPSDEDSAVAGTGASSPAEEPTLASFVGQACEADHLVMTQGEESNYCNEDDAGAFVWVSQTTHEKDVADAKELAEAKAAAEAKAKEEAAAKKAAQEKAKQQAVAKKAAEEKAAAKKAAEEQAVAEAKAQAKAEAERKAAAEAKEAAAQQAAADAAAEAERRAEEEEQAQIETLVDDTAGSSAYYENCDAVRAAGADPVYSGDPGYSRKLDRDGDGVGCE